MSTFGWFLRHYSVNPLHSTHTPNTTHPRTHHHKKSERTDINWTVFEKGVHVLDCITEKNLSCNLWVGGSEPKVQRKVNKIICIWPTEAAAGAPNTTPPQDLVALALGNGHNVHQNTQYSGPPRAYSGSPLAARCRVAQPTQRNREIHSCDDRITLDHSLLIVRKTRHWTKQSFPAVKLVTQVSKQCLASFRCVEMLYWAQLIVGNSYDCLKQNHGSQAQNDHTSPAITVVDGRIIIILTKKRKKKTESAAKHPYPRWVL